MTATYQDFQRWLQEGKKRGARWVVIGLDTFDYGNYPVYVMPDENPWKVVKHIGDNGGGGMGDRLEEVYDLELSIESQMQERRAIHLPPRPESAEWEAL